MPRKKPQSGENLDYSRIGNVEVRALEDEVQKSYLDYAMSVIVSRALPDVRDGLKPSQRRILVAMNDLNLTHRAKHRKCAKITGDTSGNYHPHGEQVIYPTLVHMAQEFALRYPLVDGQGNFGSIDGDMPAAQRYTEARMSAIAEEMLLDIDKDTVDFVPNYDNTRDEPKVLPAKVPQLLLNGSVGIAVGMATNIPPHNLGELSDGLIFLIDNKEAEVPELLKFVKGPDFPTRGIIYNPKDIEEAYTTGRGKIVLRGRAEIEEGRRGNQIVITEIPFAVNKAQMVQKVAELVKDKKIDGIVDLRDESDRRGIRVVVELKSSAYPNKVLNALYEHTQLQTVFHVNMLALTKELEPKVMNLKEMMQHYLDHRFEVVTRRTEFLLQKAKDRAHILEGLKIALDHIDEVIKTIRASANRDVAKNNLISKFKLSNKQAEAILEMRLSALAALERQRVEEELKEKIALIAELEGILADPVKVWEIIKSELKEVKERYADPRRTEIKLESLGKFSAEDLIPDEEMIISLTQSNYIKRTPLSAFRTQARGGKGVVGMNTKEEDIVQDLLSASTHDDILFFTNRGRLFQAKVYELPAASRQAKGQALVNIISIGQDEKVTTVITLKKNALNGLKYFVMGTKLGVVKKTEIEAYKSVRRSGIVALRIKSNDELKWVKTSTGSDCVFEASARGQAILYNEKDLRPLGRSASGVRGMKLRAGDEVMAMDVVKNEDVERTDALIVLENGFGKRTKLSHFSVQGRGGIGIKVANVTPKTGQLIGMHLTRGEKDDVLLVSKVGQMIRMPLKNIKRLGRDTQGVTLMKMRAGDKVASVALISKGNEEEADAVLSQSTPTLPSPPGQSFSKSPIKPRAKRPAVGKSVTRKSAPGSRNRQQPKTKPNIEAKKLNQDSKKLVTDKAKLPTKNRTGLKSAAKPLLKVKVNRYRGDVKYE